MILGHRFKILTICVWLMVGNTHAQGHFLFRQPISVADSSGFYKLELSPELLAKSNTSLADLRLLADAGKETAYVVEKASIGPLTKTDPLEILSKSIASDKKMHVLLRNGAGIVSDFLLQVQNTDAFRTVNISGSNDQKQWFIIKENIALEKSNGDAANGSYTVAFHVEPVNYAYFDISFKEKELLPANILSVSSIRVGAVANAALFDTLNTSIVTQKDSLKRSYISISWKETFPLNRIQLQTTGAKYFRREGYIRSASGNIPFVIDSENDGWIDIESKSRMIEIVILNADNQPLKVAVVKGLVKKHCLYAWLEKDRSYALYFGDSSLSTAPDYDLAYFKDRIKQNTPMLSLGAIGSIDTKPSISATETSKANTWMWWALGLVLAIMLVFTYKLINDMNNRQKS